MKLYITKYIKQLCHSSESQKVNYYKQSSNKGLFINDVITGWGGGG